MYRGDPKKALVQNFFSGVIENVSKKGVYVVKVKYKIRPALTDKEMLDRKNDERFCQVCFQFEKHDYNCDNSGWPK